MTYAQTEFRSSNGVTVSISAGQKPDPQQAMSGMQSTCCPRQHSGYQSTQAPFVFNGGGAPQGLQFFESQRQNQVFGSPNMRDFTSSNSFQAPGNNAAPSYGQAQASYTNPLQRLYMNMMNFFMQMMGQPPMGGGGPGWGGGMPAQPGNGCGPGVFPQPLPDPGYCPPPSYGQPPRNEFSQQSDASLAQALQNSFGTFEDPKRRGYISEKSLKAIADRPYPSGNFSQDRDTLLAQEYLMRPNLLGLSDKHSETGKYDGLIDRKNLQIAVDKSKGNSNPYYGYGVTTSSLPG